MTFSVCLPSFAKSERESFSCYAARPIAGPPFFFCWLHIMETCLQPAAYNYLSLHETVSVYMPRTFSTPSVFPSQTPPPSMKARRESGETRHCLPAFMPFSSPEAISRRTVLVETRSFSDTSEVVSRFSIFSSHCFRVKGPPCNTPQEAFLFTCAAVQGPQLPLSNSAPPRQRGRG